MKPKPKPCPKCKRIAQRLREKGVKVTVRCRKGHLVGPEGRIT